jgi:hypothetical protein
LCRPMPSDDGLLPHIAPMAITVPHGSAWSVRLIQTSSIPVTQCT